MQFLLFWMINKMKQISRLAFTLLAVLVLFAGCGKSDGEGANSLASIVAATVNCFATANKISTQGSSRLTYNARITSQGDTEWCSFALNSQVSTTDGRVGDPIYLYLKQNLTDGDRTAVIEVTFSDGYATTLSFTQTKFSESADYDKAWGEQPAMRFGSDYLYKTYHTTLSNGKNVRNYSICYDRTKHVSHWVAYPVHKVYTGGRSSYKVGTSTAGRTDAWAYDDSQTEYQSSRPYYRVLGRNITQPGIAESDQQYILRGYGVSGYDRGHILPSASRYNTWATNAQTFYATNMMPQNSTLNQNVWSTLENNVRTWGGAQNYDTLFVVTGTFFGDLKTISNSNGPIRVPTHCWKVILRQKGNQNRQISDFSANELKAIGFIFENNSTGAATSLRNAARSVQEIEAKTGFEFFRNLAPEVADAVKSQKNYDDWPGL